MSISNENASSIVDGTKGEEEQPDINAIDAVPNLQLDSITDGQSERGIPIVKFIEDITGFSQSFDPPASSELLIGAYSDLFAKFKSYEGSLSQKRAAFLEKIPEIEKSLALVQHLQSKADKDNDDEPLVVRYSLADAVFAKAELDQSDKKVYLWLGANVMLEYSYTDAIELLESKLQLAKKELMETTSDLEFTRNQIITAEVCISRIYNWDVRRKRILATSGGVSGST